MQDWKTYLWLTFVALCAGMIRLPDVLKDANGKTRWGMLVLQFPTALVMVVLAKAAAPFILHFFPYAGDLVVDGLTAFFAFAGPMAVPKLLDALIDVLKTRLGGTR